MTRLWRRGGDEGSTLLVTLGYALLAIALIVVTMGATDLHIAQKRLDALADAAALAGADGFTIVATSDGIRGELEDAAIAAQARAVIAVSPLDAALVRAHTPDGISARVTLATAWRPPLLSPFLPVEVELEATAASRTAFR